MGVGAGVPGCTKSEPDGSANTTVASAPGPASSFDLQANMTAMVEALRAERAVLTKALQSWSSIGEADRRAFWGAMSEQRRLADELSIAMEANPAWVETVCRWYDSTLRKPYGETVRLRNRLREQHTGSSTRNDLNQLLLDSAGAQSAVQEHFRFMHESPGEPTNLHILCVKSGHVEDDS
jgi:hypothetical protein